MFRIRPFEAKTTSWWAAQRGVIDFHPPYQRRGRIWTNAAKAYLIDSIINDFDVPKFYLADFSYVDSSLNLNKKQFAVIDGKQRLEAIFDFYDGGLLLRDDFVYSGDPSLELKGLSYKDLRNNYPEVASKFETFNLSVMSVITDDEGKINDLFVRLNSSKPLTAPEYRNAMKGLVPPLTRRLAQHKFFAEFTSFKSSRGEDQQVAAKFLLVEFRGGLVDTKRAQLDRLVTEVVLAEAESQEVERAGARAEGVLDSMCKVFEPRDPLLKSQGPLVVYYWLVRALGPDPRLRTFLTEFERERTENRERAKEVGNLEIDSVLLQYDSLSRSINDVGSLRGRFKILLQRFDEVPRR